MYRNFHNLVGTGRGEDVKVIAVVTKAEYSVNLDRFTSYMRISELTSCSYYHSCKASLVSASTFSRTSLATLLQEILTFPR